MRSMREAISANHFAAWASEFRARYGARSAE
jgi:queuine/archaeosine tRNA-ribosyltransferase